MYNRNGSNNRYALNDLLFLFYLDCVKLENIIHKSFLEKLKLLKHQK